MNFNKDPIFTPPPKTHSHFVHILPKTQLESKLQGLKFLTFPSFLNPNSNFRSHSSLGSDWWVREGQEGGGVGKEEAKGDHHNKGGNEELDVDVVAPVTVKRWPWLPMWTHLLLQGTKKKKRKTRSKRGRRRRERFLEFFPFLVAKWKKVGEEERIAHKKHNGGPKREMLFKACNLRVNSFFGLK